MWMVFGENGQYATSANTPAPTLNQLGTLKQNGGVISRVYFAPDSDSYIVTDGKTCTSFQTPPSDLLAAIQSIIQSLGGSAQLPPSVSWVGNGIWAVCCGGQYRLGANVPASLTAQLNSIGPPSDANDRWVSNLIVFAPSAEWLLQGSGAHDEGSAELYFSPGFPAATKQWIQNTALPGHTCIQNFEFDPSGGWIMVDTQNNVYYSPSGIDAALKQAVTTMQKAGNVVVDFACLTLQQPVLPMSSVQQPPPVQANFQTGEGFGTISLGSSQSQGFLMKAVVNNIDSGGNVFGQTGLMSATWTSGFHGTTIVAFLDFTGNVIAPLSDPPVIAERFASPDNVAGSGQNVPGFFSWQGSLGTSYLQLIRKICISNVYSPDSLAITINKWTSAIGSNAKNLEPVAQDVGIKGASGGKSSG